MGFVGGAGGAPGLLCLEGWCGSRPRRGCAHDRRAGGSRGHPRLIADAERDNAGERADNIEEHAAPPARRSDRARIGVLFLASDEARSSRSRTHSSSTRLYSSCPACVVSVDTTMTIVIDAFKTGFVQAPTAGQRLPLSPANDTRGGRSARSFRRQFGIGFGGRRLCFLMERLCRPGAIDTSSGALGAPSTATRPS